jgi:hypothetical protein
MTAPAQRSIVVGGPADDDAHQPGELACAWCGCTEENACIDEDTGETCGWAAPVRRHDPACCTFCAERLEHGIACQEAADPGNPVLAAADAFNAREGLWPAAPPVPAAAALAAGGALLFDAYGRPWQSDNDNDEHDEQGGAA